MKNSSSPESESPDSQHLLNQIVLDFMKERKNKRRWRWFVRGLMLALIGYVFYVVMSFSDDDKEGQEKPHVGLVDIKGGIFEGQSADANNFVKSLDSAYKSKGLKALIIRINSPGGSPVQADYMYTAIQYYKSLHRDIKIHAVCVDMCASAAYYVASAADDIYANQSSLVGSIGVLYNGFGFVDAIEKLGITRRLKTAGSNKGFLDPFTPVNPEQDKLLQSMLDDIHQQFINRVKAGRGTRLHIDSQVFSGLFWTGEQAKTRGLIDGFASSGQVARNIDKLDKVIDYTFKESVFERVSKSMGTAIAEGLPLALGLTPGVKA